MRYEAGANGYRILPITEQEFAIMMKGAASQPKTRETNKFVSASKHHHPQPQPIFPTSREENRSTCMGRAKENLHPKSTFPAMNMESSKKERRLAKLPVSKDEGGGSSSKRKSLEEKAPLIIPAFLRPKVRIYQNCRRFFSSSL